jgi:hypothetical protein
MTEPTCPSPGGCRSCPDPRYCAVMRIDFNITCPKEELAVTTPRPYPPVITAMVNWSEEIGV